MAKDSGLVQIEHADERLIADWEGMALGIYFGLIVIGKIGI